MPLQSRWLHPSWDCSNSAQSFRCRFDEARPFERGFADSIFFLSDAVARLGQKQARIPNDGDALLNAAIRKRIIWIRLYSCIFRNDDYYEKNSMPTFDNFWNWLTNLPPNHQILNLGEKNLHCTIVINNDGGQITPNGGKTHRFSRQDALLTWTRFHGLRQAEKYFAKKSKHYPRFDPFDKYRPFLMTSSFAHPVGLIQNWHHSPNRNCCPWIAAAIKAFCISEHPDLL